MSSSGAKKIETTSRCGYFSACVIDDNKVLITYLNYASDQHYTLKARVLIISGSDIIYGSETDLDQTNNGVHSYIYSQLITVDKNKAFLIYRKDIKSSSSGTYNWQRYACVLTVSENTTIKGTKLTLDSFDYTPIAISNYQVLLLYAGSNNMLVSQMYTITGDTIKRVSTVTLNSTLQTGSNIKATALSQNKVLIIHRQTSGNAENLSALICTITGNVITVDKENTISLKTTDLNSINNVDLITLSENKALLLFTNSYGYICSKFYNIEGDTVTESVTTQLSSIYSSSINRVLKLNENKLLIGYFDSNNYLHDIICDIEENSITVTGKDVLVSTTTVSGYNIGEFLLLKTSENNVFAGYSFPQSSTYILAQNYFDRVVKAVKNKNEVINGVAITSGQDGEMVQIKVPGEE